MFYAGTLGYFAQYTALGQMASIQQHAQVSLMPSAGTYGYEPNVNYFFGFPRAIEAGGVVMDLDRVATAVGTSAGNQQQQYNFVLQLGVLSSALEHAVPEQMFSTSASPADAVSAVKALSKAAAAGQRIYHITPENQALTLSHIGHDAVTMAEIRAALAVGKEVITHTNAIAVPGWSGAGYIIFDPETGAGAYKIGGGLNGAVFILLIVTITFLAWAILFAGAGGALILPLVLTSINFAKFTYDISQATNDTQANNASAAASIRYLISFLPVPSLIKGEAIALKIVASAALYLSSFFAG